MFEKTIRVSSGVNQLDRQLGGLFIGDNALWYANAGRLEKNNPPSRQG